MFLTRLRVFPLRRHWGQSRRWSLAPNSAATSRKLSSSRPVDLTGVFPPIPTAFNQDESIAYDKMEANLKIWEKVAFSGYLVLGSNGETPYMTPTERVDVVRLVRESVAKDKLVLAGAGCEATRDTVTMVQQMADAGADAVMVVTPCYYKQLMTADALKAHFTAVADQSPVPVVLYSVPSNTSVDLAPEVVTELATHPNIIGMKDSGGNIAKIGRMVHETKAMDFQILAGSAGFLLPALLLGCVGGVCALANVLGEEACHLQYLHQQGRLEEAAQLQHRLITPNAAVTSRYGVPGLKAAMDWAGLYGGPPRSPIQRCTPAQLQSLRKAFTDSGFLCTP